MTEYQEFLQERDRIDYLMQMGYKIINVSENLSGAFVEFMKQENKKEIYETLHVCTAEGRKYFSMVLINQDKAV